MARAIWNGQILAESDLYEVVETNIYFPPESINSEYFTKSDKKTTCPRKGEARYYDIIVDEKINENAAWYYPQPKEEAKQITGYVAFYNSVEVHK